MIGAARTALASTLNGAGIRAFATVPERVSPPMAVIEPSSDWVVSGDTFGSYRVGFTVTLIVQHAANATVSDALDNLVDSTLDAIAGAAGFYTAAVTAPDILAVQNAEYLSTTLTVYQNTSL